MAKVSRLQAIVDELKKTVDEQTKEMRKLRTSVEDLRKGGTGKDR
jgi:flagellar biosynthesis chaperone FliJ